MSGTCTAVLAAKELHGITISIRPLRCELPLWHDGPHKTHAPDGQELLFPR